MTADSTRIADQLQFLNEIEKLKVVYRHNRTIDGARYENSAEHSWHVAVMALVLREHADTPHLDILKVVKMLLIHDLVEVYAGDTWVYDAAASLEQVDREESAATELFSLLPSDQATEFHALWREFEVSDSAEAIYARAIDSLQPLTNHLAIGGDNPEEPRPTKSQVIESKRHIADGSKALWNTAQSIIDESVARGLYRDEPAGS